MPHGAEMPSIITLFFCVCVRTQKVTVRYMRIRLLVTENKNTILLRFGSLIELGDVLDFPATLRGGEDE